MNEKKPPSLNRRCAVIALSILLAFAFLGTAVIEGATENDDYQIDREVIDCGNQRTIDGDVYQAIERDWGKIYGTGGIELSGGYSLPVEAVYKYPSEVTPGENVTVEVSMDNEEGSLWYDFMGEVGAGVHTDLFEIDWDEDYRIDDELITFDVPVSGDEVDKEIDEEFKLAAWREEVDSKWIEVDIRVGLDIPLSWSSHVEGNASIWGDAVQTEENENMKWMSNEDVGMISAAVDEDAEEGDTVNASVEDLTYNLDGLSLEVENAALYVGWDTNVDILPDPDPFLIETSFSFDIPVGFSAQSTDSETMSGDESVQLLEEDPVEEGMGMESEIRVVESREDDGTSPIEGIPTTNKFEDSGGGVLITALIIGAIAFVGLSYGLKQDKN